MGTFNFQLPDMNGSKEDTKEAIRKLTSYVYQLNEQLRHQFTSIDDQNITPGSLTESTLDQELRRKVVDAAGNYTKFEQTARNILMMVSGISNRNLVKQSDNPQESADTILYELDLPVFTALQGEKVTMAVDVWDETDGEHVIDLCLMDQAGVVGNRSYIISITGDTSRPAYTMEIPDLSASTELYFAIRGNTQVPGGSANAGVFNANHPKIEKGINATEWTQAPGDFASGVINSIILLDSSGIFMSGGEIYLLAGGLLRLEGAAVDIDTLLFTIKLNGQERLAFDEDGNLAVNAGSITSDRFIGDVVNSHEGSLSITAGPSIQTTLNSINKYLKQPVTLIIPAGSRAENVTIEGYMGAGLTIEFTDGADVVGTWTIRNCSRVELVRNGSSAYPPRIIGASGDDVVIAENIGSFNMLDMVVIGKPRTTAINGSKNCVNIMSSKAMVIGCAFHRALVGVLAEMSSVLYAEDNTGGVDGSTDPTGLALLEHGIYAAYGSHVGVGGSVPFGGVLNAAADGTSTIVGTGTATEGDDPGSEDPPPDHVTYQSTAYYRMADVHRRTGSAYNGGSISWGSYSHSYYEGWYTTGLPRQRYLTMSIVTTGSNGSIVYYRQDRMYYFSAWIFPTIADLSSIIAARLTVTRDTTGGATGSVTVKIYKHPFTGQPGSSSDRNQLVDTGLTLTLGRGQTGTVTLDATTLAELKAGTIKGFGLADAPDYASMAANCSLEVDL